MCLSLPSSLGDVPFGEVCGASRFKAREMRCDSIRGGSGIVRLSVDGAAAVAAMQPHQSACSGAAEANAEFASQSNYWISGRSGHESWADTMSSVATTSSGASKWSPLQQRSWLGLTIVLSAVTGDTAARGWTVAPCIVTGLTCSSVVLYARASGFGFGCTGVTSGQMRREAMLSTLYVAATIPWLLYSLFPEPVEIIETCFYVVSALSYIFINRQLTARFLAMYATVALLIKGSIALSTGNYADELAYKFWNCMVQAWILLLTCFLRYRKDQICMVFLAALSISASYGGSQITHTPSRSLAVSVIVLWLLYWNHLWMRRQRQLPPGLGGCKFVKLSFLRKLVATGQGIQRCQDLPSHAFGDPIKATFLLAISHRWLNRLTCDVTTPDCPEGFRLRKMVDQLNSHFSQENFLQGWKEGGLREVWRRTGLSLTGGDDVLVFFDFMSLPQDGRRTDGSPVLRTTQEEKQFRRCLPHMGALYSMFPVMVCEDVVEGALGYDSSGWCFAEASTAWLGKQLWPFSTESSVVKWFESWDRTISSSGDLIAKLNAELENKHFLNETDRGAVSLIIRGFVVKHLLVEAIQRKDAGRLKEALSDLSAQWKAMLDQPIDANLNTPLHLAVSTGFSEGVLILMEHGADPKLKNLWGDTPVQCMAFPRVSKAAWTCRHTEKIERDEFEVEEIFFSIYASDLMQSQASSQPKVATEDHADGTSPRSDPEDSHRQEGKMRVSSYANVVSLDSDCDRQLGDPTKKVSI